MQSRTRPAERTRQEIDYGRRAKGYIFGAFCPATGEAFTHPYPGRGGAHWVDFLEHVETWIPSTTRRVYAIMDNLSSHRTTDVLLFLLAHPRWEMVFQPKYAAYLNLIEPWWKILRSLALAGRRFESWEEIADAIHCSRGLLECTPPSLRLGQTPSASASPLARHCPPAESRMTCRMHHLADVELSHEGRAVRQAVSCALHGTNTVWNSVNEISERSARRGPNGPRRSSCAISP